MNQIQRMAVERGWPTDRTEQIISTEIFMVMIKGAEVQIPQGFPPFYHVGEERPLHLNLPDGTGTTMQHGK